MRKLLHTIVLVAFLGIALQGNAQRNRQVRTANGTLASSIVPHSTYRPNNTLSCSVDTITLTTQAAITNFATTYPTCTTPKYLIINGAGANPAITSLAGLSSITQIVNKLVIKNTSVTSLASLNNITSIADTFEVANNPLLSSIGMTNLTQLGAMVFQNLPALNNLIGFSTNLNYVGSIRLDTTALTTLSGLSNIDSIIIPNGGLYIGFCPLTNLNSLTDLKRINGYMTLERMNQLTSVGLNNLQQCWGFLFWGLPNLTNIANLSTHLTNQNSGTFWFINTGLANLSGMDSIVSAANFYLWSNPNLTSLQGLNRLAGSLYFGFSLHDNPILTNITALTNITTISNGRLEINSCPQLTNLTGIGNITLIGNGLKISNNANLDSLGMLHPNLVIDNLNPNDNDSLEIYDNPQLSLCAYTPICQYLNNIGNGNIFNNAVGCNSTNEVANSCGITYNDNEDNCCTYNAIALPENTDKYGNVGQYDPVADDFVDEYDTYRIILPNAGSIKLFAEAQKDSCDANQLSVELLDKQGNSFLFGNYFTIIDFNTNPCGTILNDSIRIAALAADTFYIRLHSNNQVRYKISYQLIDTVANVDNDIEPNNTYTQALPINVSINKKGILGYRKLAYSNYDVTDVYKTYLPNGGNIKVFIKSTYGGQNPLNFATYNDYYFTVNNNPTGSKAILPNGLAMSYGDVHYDTLTICAVVGDTVYFNITSNLTNYAFEYELKYEVTNAGLPPNDLEPNGSFTTATPIAYNEVKQGLVKAVAYSPVFGEDHQDFYKTYLPKNGTLKVIFTGANISCENNNTSIFSLYKKNGAASEPIQPSYSVGDTLTYCSLIADSAYFVISAYYPLSYTFKYEMIDTAIVNDIEPNNTIATAIPIAKGSNKKGTLSFKNNIFEDVNDYYRVIFPCADTLKLTSIFTDKSCDGINNYYVGTAIRLYNKNGVLVNSKPIPNFAIGQVIYDTTNFAIPIADTFYLNYSQVALGSNIASLSYDFTVKNTAPSSSFIITGADSSCLNSKIYKAENICGSGITYHWSLSSGGTLSAADSIATVNWTTAGVHTISLYLTNAYGSSITKQYLVTVVPPVAATAPMVTATGRNLKTTTAPIGVSYQWYKTGVAINGANDSTYFAADSGSYTVRYKNYCGTSNASNAIYFALPFLNQTITFSPLTPDAVYAANAYVITKATATSNLPVVYSIVIGNATINLDSVKITGAGTIIIGANQAGSINFNVAPTKYDTIQVTPANQTINFPTIANKKYSDTAITLQATSSAGLPITYVVLSGNATVSGSILTMTGVGTVTIQATQSGNGNYTAAAPISQSFCIGVSNLSSIQGSVQPCFSTYKYTTKKIVGATYSWTLSSGGALTFTNDTATVVWSTAGTHTLTVKANSSCDAMYNTIESVTINPTNNVPTSVSNMLPTNNAINQQLPLQLSWIPGQFTVSYDLYIWRSDTLQPATPFATNINNVAFVIQNGALAYNKTYNWRVVSKNPCNQTFGPIQQFSLIPLPDLQVLNVQAPTTAFTGQNIAINWTVKNIGPGRTNTNQGWYDAVYLSYDSANAFVVPPNTTSVAWNASSRTLLIGTKQNVTALDSGQQYTNTLNYTMPLNTTAPTYVYVITNLSNLLLENTRVNDTAQAPQPIAVTISPTPDLRVDTVFASNTTFSGSTINVTYKVKNYGANTPVGSFWQDKIYLSSSPLFNINNAIELKAPKFNDTYYYNNPSTNISTNVIVQTDSSISKSVNVVLPNFIQGTYFIHVVVNANQNLYEGATANNNTNYKQFQILMTPTPKLEIASLNLSNINFSNTQSININYNLVNNGFFDNIEKNQGHHIKVSRCDNCGGGGIEYTVNTGGSSNNNTPCYIQYTRTDSIGWGSSIWNDNIYLSTDSTGLNSGNALLLTTQLQGDNTKASIAGFDFDLNTTCVLNFLDGNSRNIFNVIRPAKIFPTVVTAAIPSNLAAGNYFIYVWANANKGVFEFPANNEIKRTGMLTVGNPDLTIPTATAPASVNAGQAFNITYTVANTNNNGVFNANRADHIFVSNSPIYDNTAVLVNNTSYVENVLQNAPVTRTVTYTFPFNTVGTRYIFIRTNAANTIKETTLANNFNSTPISINVTTPPASATSDLVVTTIAMADTVFAKLPIQIQYTVPNNGLGAAQGAWTDSVFVSCNATYNPATAKFVALRQQNRIVAGGSSYTDAFNFTTDFASNVNNCFPVQQFNNAYFFVKTNANNAVYEGANTNNNVLGTGLKVWVNPWPDYVVTQVNSVLDTANVGRPFPASWVVKNLQYNYINNTYFDGLYFSTDSTFNNNAVLGNNYKQQIRNLAQNQTYTDNFIFTTPNLPTGNYYVHLKTNNFNNINNENTTNNTNVIRNVNGSAKKIYLIQPALPDFTDSITQAPTTIAIGQPITVKAKITNSGLGANYPSAISNALRLNTDFSAGGYILGTTTTSMVLNAGQSYNDSITYTLPLTIPAGNYILVWYTNATNTIFETNINNNLAFKYITVIHPTPVDLVVNNVTIPDTATLGYGIDSVKWNVYNNSLNIASGVSSDGVYLSNTTVVDSTAALLGLFTKQLTIPALQQQQHTKSIVVNNVKEGSYNVLVKTDVLNNIVETNKNNNVGLANKKVYVKVKELPLNVLTPTTLNNEVYRYYKLKIPDSLRGSTIQVTLKTNDSLTRTNQLYIGAGYVPNPALFDYKYDVPNYGNQTIVMTSVNDSLYYITVRNVNTAALQNITLKAVKLPFTILTVQANSGGNTGNVTVKISGNLFNNTMQAKLTLGATTITASNVYFANSTTVYATFNLASRALGVYNVELYKTTDSTTAILPNGFSIVNANNGGLITGGGVNGTPGNGNDPGCEPNAASGLNAQLVLNIDMPATFFIPFPFEFKVNFTNPTNVDIPAQTRVIYTDNGTVMATTAAGLPMGTSSMHITITEPGGPPGIIRAGASGTITFFAKAPNSMPGHTLVTITAK